MQRNAVRMGLSSLIHACNPLRLPSMGQDTGWWTVAEEISVIPDSGCGGATVGKTYQEDCRDKDKGTHLSLVQSLGHSFLKRSKGLRKHKTQLHHEGNEHNTAAEQEQLKQQTLRGDITAAAGMRVLLSPAAVLEMYLFRSVSQAVDVNLDKHSSCPFSRWDQFSKVYGQLGPFPYIDLAPSYEVSWASFLNCSQAVWKNGRFVLAPLVVLIYLAHKYWKARITIDAVEKFLLMQQVLGPMRYAYTDVTAITSHFRDKLGQGCYDSVYKGVLLPGDVHVAIKMLGNSKCNGEEFISEVATIGRIHHVNVVRLLGFCSEEMRRALLYEYVPNGSLDKYIFSSEKRFSWDKLNEIALGIARGINYLHQGCDMHILHFDIKPHNILLDSNFVPKVADFGLAKLFPRDNTFVPMSAMRETIGYIAPEMVSRSFGAISSKSDVYSFGMVLLEMAGGRRNADNGENSSQAYYPSLVYSR
ncbi:Rust resistance kinase Lr10 [Dichanthelium oligosanthes]|uniref:non-specific serine/threonine protein kinase n=1 Tax=Dichanthelium oligosanthes TaxID=888268 RepID=A0A1E5WID2_9POAL|nr:Rust resistance kinase Lr10 [Dichanthelium oligosanthes]